MILAVGILATKRWLHRFAWFLVVFGIWDIAYYVFLKILIGWPQSLLTYDILFLIPSIWTGPVVAPVINSITMIALAASILSDREGVVTVSRLSPLIWLLLILGSLIILVAYMEDYAGFVLEYTRTIPSGHVSWKEYTAVLPSQFMPGSFDWLLYLSGVIMHITAIAIILFRKRTTV
jgi:hypothetical protein